MSVVPELQTHVALSCKTYRNFRAFLWTADQDAATYFGVDGRGSRDEQRIAGNSFIKLFFRQEGQGAAIIANAYEQLADDHIQAIRTAPQGQLIALFGDEVHPLVMQLTDAEVLAFCTPARPRAATPTVPAGTVTMLFWRGGDGTTAQTQARRCSKKNWWR